MKRLSVNIEDVHIKGGAAQLTAIITSMDISLQKLSQATEDITGTVMKYSASNRGHQYQKMATSLASLNARLYDASLDMNNMQNEIVAYQNKVMRYEDQAQTAHLPNKHVVNKANLNVEVNDIEFTLMDMLAVKNGLITYSENVFHEMQDIVSKKNEIGQNWLDTQYNSFAEFIDELNMDTLYSLKMFGEYIGYLDERIKELSR